MTCSKRRLFENCVILLCSVCLFLAARTAFREAFLTCVSGQLIGEPKALDVLHRAHELVVEVLPPPPGGAVQTVEFPEMLR